MIRRIIFVSLILTAGVGLWLSWGRLKTRYLLPAVGQHLAQRIEQRSGWLLSYRGISGNLWTELDLYGVRLTPARTPAWVRPSDADLAVVADAVHIRYQPWDALRGRIRSLTTERPSLRAGSLRAELTVMQTRDLLVLGLPTQAISTTELAALLALPPGIDLAGHVQVGGECLLKDYRPHLAELRLHSDGLTIRSGRDVELPLRADLRIGRDLGVSGRLELTGGHWRPGGRGWARALADPIIMSLATSLLPGTVDLQVDGRDLWLHAGSLHAKLRGSLRLRKAPLQLARLEGSIDAMEGLYLADRRRFALRRGTLRFDGEPGHAPQLTAQLQTRIRRHHVAAALEGPMDAPILRLSSQPPLPQADIVALLTAGRASDRLFSDVVAPADAGDPATRNAETSGIPMRWKL